MVKYEHFLKCIPAPLFRFLSMPLLVSLQQYQLVHVVKLVVNLVLSVIFHLLL